MESTIRLIFLIIFLISCGRGFYINEDEDYYNNDNYIQESSEEEEVIVTPICTYSAVTSDVYFSYRLDEGSFSGFSTALLDSSSNGTRQANFYSNDGIDKTISGKHGSGVYFDGVDDEILQDSSIGFTGYNFTFSLWFKHQGGADITGNDPQYLIGMGNYNTNNSFNFILGETSSAFSGIFRLHAKYHDSNSDVVSFANAAYLDNVWHHLVITKNTSGVTIYVDNVQVGQETDAGDKQYQSWDAIEFGNKDVTNFREFKGSMDEINFWNRELTTDEISDLYNCVPE